MLFEKTTYADDFPLNIQIIQVDEIPFHYHQDVELVYVLTVSYTHLDVYKRQQ